MTIERDLGDEPRARLARHRARHPLADRRRRAGQRPRPGLATPADSPAARRGARLGRRVGHVFPVLRPAGTHGTMLAEIDPDALAPRA